MREDEEHPMVWEDEAQKAIEGLVSSAEYDDICGTINLSSYNDGHGFGLESSSMEELHSNLVDVYVEAWYANVPFEGGEAVFRDDAWGAVDELLYEYQEIETFFERHAPPDSVLELCTAKDLLADPNASKVVRVSLEEINDELVRYLAANPEKMREMSPRKFEELIADMFSNQGFEVTLTPQSKDGGMDVIAVQRDGVGTVMIIVECKRYSAKNKVGVEIARGLYGVVEQKRATQGIIATTSSFTRGVVDFRATVPYRLGLADFDVLKQQIEEWKGRIST